MQEGAAQAALALTCKALEDVAKQKGDRVLWPLQQPQDAIASEDRADRR